MSRYGIGAHPSGRRVFLVHPPIRLQHDLEGPVGRYRAHRPHLLAHADPRHTLGPVRCKPNLLSQSHRPRPRQDNGLQRGHRGLRECGHARNCDHTLHPRSQTPLPVHTLDLLLPSCHCHVVVRSVAEHTLGIPDGLVPRHDGTGCCVVPPGQADHHLGRADRGDPRCGRRELLLAAGTADLAHRIGCSLLPPPSHVIRVRLGSVRSGNGGDVLLPIRFSRRIPGRQALLRPPTPDRRP